MTDDDQWYEIAKRIGELRAERGLSRSELARRLDVHRNTVGNWEAGHAIPVERCAALADALDVEVDELLSLHPHAHVETRDDPPAPLWKKPVATASMVTGLVGLAMYLTWQLATPSCISTGAGGGSLSGLFREAYEEYGGSPTLGCATNDVHVWGPAYVQDFHGGSFDSSILISLDRQEVFVLGGAAWQGFRAVAQGTTTEYIGGPTDLPRQCGGTVIIPVDGGGTGPGAMVSLTDGSYVWLEPDLWVAYQSVGGPESELGRPVDLIRTDAGWSLRLESGTIDRRYGEGVMTSADVEADSDFDPMDCPIADLESAFGVSAVSG